MVRNHKGGGNRQPKEFYERPLTPEEAQFATDNINIVFNEKFNIAGTGLTGGGTVKAEIIEIKSNSERMEQ